MKTKQIFCVSAALALLLCAATANADTLFSYDFEDPPVTTGNIVGQDSWQVTGLNPSNWVEPYVGNGTNGNTTQVFLGNPAGTTSTAKPREQSVTTPPRWSSTPPTPLWN